MRGLVVCVNYDDLLRITLASNMRFLDGCCVVTSPDDVKTKQACKSIKNVTVFETDAFTRYGASFNKGLAIEEALNFYGRVGQFLIWDADTLFPDDMTSRFVRFRNDCLYSCKRVLFENPKAWNYQNPSSNWSRSKPTRDREFCGYFQLFNASDPHLKDKPFWYDPTFAHAGGSDSYFQNLWPVSRKIRMDFSVLHLGPRDVNWFGRSSERLDGVTYSDADEKFEKLKKLRQKNKWDITGKFVPSEAVEDRIVVPGYTSDYVWWNSHPPSKDAP